MITLMSYGQHYGPPTPGYARAVDVSSWPNPHVQPELRALSGLDVRVQRYVLKWWMVRTALSHLTDGHWGIQDGESVVVGCRYGRHRSVAVVEGLARRLRKRGHAVKVTHRDVEK